MKLNLVSFALCPYVQRSVITLKHKKVPYDITFIEDLQNPPAWFLEISPRGMVPVLRVDDRHTIFESAVINEFIDDITQPELKSRDPVTRAKERAWIEFGSSLLVSQYGMIFAETREEALAAKAELFDELRHVEAAVSGGPCFRGSEFSLVDTAYAPFFMRLALVDALWSDPAWSKLPKTRAWAETLLAMPEVKESVLPDFKEKYLGHVRARGSVWVK